MIEQFGQDRLVGRASSATLFARLFPRIIIIGDLLAALEKCFARLIIKVEWSASRIVGERLHLVVKERQPVFHSRIALACADGAVERVVGRIPAKSGGVIAPECPDGFVREQGFAHRHQRDPLHIARRPLGFRIEGADGLELRAEEIEAKWRFLPCREQIDQPAAHGELPRLAYRRHAKVAIVGGPGDEPNAVDHRSCGSRKGHS